MTDRAQQGDEQSGKTGGPEVPEKPVRRRLDAAQKLRILEEADRCIQRRPEVRTRRPETKSSQILARECLSDKLGDLARLESPLSNPLLTTGPCNARCRTIPSATSQCPHDELPADSRSARHLASGDDVPGWKDGHRAA